jgi:putative ABC transport system permease protein
MLKNYIKIAWKVLLRRKFFTFISLFGISLTLTVLMVVMAIANNIFGAKSPELKMDRMLFVNMVKARLTGGENWTNTGPGSYYFLNRYVRAIKSAELVSISSMFRPVNTYVNNKKLALDIKFTDYEYWKVLDFNFIQGGNFTQADVAKANLVAVINKETASQYFGSGVDVVGKYIEVDQIKYRVTGVVENVPPMKLNSYADIWVPYTTTKEDLNRKAATGGYTAMILAKSSSDLDKIKKEFDQIMKNIENPDPATIRSIEAHTDTMFEFASRQLFGNNNSNGIAIMTSIISVVALLFMTLPAMNLVNINISRIMERSSEIGIRKAFGASRYTLVGQFIVENIFLTIIGGIISLVLTFLVLRVISSSNIIPYSNFSIDFKIFFYGLCLAIFFGLLSGVYPAFKMSRMQAAEALKGGSK